MQKTFPAIINPDETVSGKAFVHNLQSIPRRAQNIEAPRNELY